MQLCFIGWTYLRRSTAQGRITEVPKDEAPLAKQQRRLHSAPIHRLDDVYHNAIRHLGNTKGSDTGKREDESQFDNSLESRAMRSSALSTRTANLIDRELSRSPSFKNYLKNDSKIYLNEDSNLNENQVCSLIDGLTIKQQQQMREPNSQEALCNSSASTSATAGVLVSRGESMSIVSDISRV